MVEITDYIKVDPIIVYPECILNGQKQDCFNCELYKKLLCNSPRSLCVRKYPGHSKGCPNYGELPTCPPNIPMFDEIFDMDKPIYLIYIKYNLGAHLEKMRIRHPNWSNRQLRNVIYWQGTARSIENVEINKFLDKYGHLGYEAITPEALGVDVFKTLENVGIILDWPPIHYTYRVSFAGIAKEGMSLKKFKCK